MRFKINDLNVLILFDDSYEFSVILSVVRNLVAVQKSKKLDLINKIIAIKIFINEINVPLIHYSNKKDNIFKIIYSFFSKIFFTYQ
jgi:hypothetical protein